MRTRPGGGGSTLKAFSAATAVFMGTPAERDISVQTRSWEEEEEEEEEGRVARPVVNVADQMGKQRCDADSSQLHSTKGAVDVDRRSADLHAGPSASSGIRLRPRLCF